MPINEPNLSPSYVLDSGDVLEIQLVSRALQKIVKEMALSILRI